MKILYDSALDKVRQGLTSLELLSASPWPRKSDRPPSPTDATRPAEVSFGRDPEASIASGHHPGSSGGSARAARPRTGCGAGRDRSRPRGRRRGPRYRRASRRRRTASPGRPAPGSATRAAGDHQVAGRQVDEDDPRPPLLDHRRGQGHVAGHQHAVAQLPRRPGHLGGEDQVAAEQDPVGPGSLGPGPCCGSRRRGFHVRSSVALNRPGRGTLANCRSIQSGVNVVQAVEDGVGARLAQLGGV